jgi:adenylate kinase family enzyme
MQRVSVVGISGSGVTTVAARLAKLLRCPHIELAALYNQVGWRPLDDARFRAVIDERTQEERWVVDGSYLNLVTEGVVWQRADTVVWLRLSKIATVARLCRRSCGRVLGRQPLRSDEGANIADVLANYDRYDRQFARYVDDARFAHITFVVLSSHAAIGKWLSGIAQAAAQNG